MALAGELFLQGVFTFIHHLNQITHTFKYTHTELTTSQMYLPSHLQITLILILYIAEESKCWIDTVHLYKLQYLIV